MKKVKAGVIPYYYDGDVVKMLFQVSSDPRYGGPDPMISKGGVEDGEYIGVAALREAYEELGLREDNIIMFNDALISVLKNYTLTLYVAHIEDPDKFDTPHFETAYTIWLTEKEFSEIGRADHRQMVKAVHALIS